jgi:hypothetical protein
MVAARFSHALLRLIDRYDPSNHLTINHDRVLDLNPGVPNSRGTFHNDLRPNCSVLDFRGENRRSEQRDGHGFPRVVDALQGQSFGFRAKIPLDMANLKFENSFRNVSLQAQTNARLELPIVNVLERECPEISSLD